ncbi:MFS family permease/DNA-binding MarR family transcriptional regulator [Streptacidiphilus sp. BW17]|uniref:MFS transporter n=1 Tax=Streptacidiphilus sp. BW17 TaxID=3156274 RepID=UPI003519383A
MGTASAPGPARQPRDRQPPWSAADHPRYKWIALSNTTLGTLLATINASIVLISLPAIFNGIHLNPLGPGNVSYLLWMLMGYMLITAVLVVTLGRLGDMWGRVRIYNSGFLIFTVVSVILSLDPLHGAGGALWLIGWRVLQAIGGAMLMANSAAIITDAFPSSQRGMALGVNMVAGIAGSFIGLVLGGLLAQWDWRSIFWVNVPIGLLGTVWAYRSLHETGIRRPARIDWWGNITFGVGLTVLLAGITYGIQPYGGSTMGWTNPLVLGGLVGGAALLVLFCLVETRVVEPMFPLRLFRDRAFAGGNAAALLGSVARGGMQFMLIIWLQGIWLPLHGYNYADTPLWAGIYLIPLTIGFLASGPVAGHLSDRFGARLFAASGFVVMAVSFAGLLLLPTDFSYWVFALLVFLNGVGGGLFAAPNTSIIMSSVPAESRGAASGMRATFQNAGMVLSIGVFFSLMIAGLAGSLPHTLSSGLTAQGVPAADAARVAALPPVGTLFAAFLGYNPIQQLLGPHVLGQLPAANQSLLTGRAFFPHLISGPFHNGLVVVFTLAIAMSLVAAATSMIRGRTAPSRTPETGTGGHTVMVQPATGQDTETTRLRLAIARLYRQMAQASHSQDLNLSQLSALARIEEHGPLRLGELASREGVAAPSMTRTLTALSYGGLIERRPDPDDRRSFLVTATPQGLALLARLRQERSELLADRIGRLTAEQREALRSALDVLELLLDQPAQDAAAPDDRTPIG